MPMFLLLWSLPVCCSIATGKYVLPEKVKVEGYPAHVELSWHNQPAFNYEIYRALPGKSFVKCGETQSDNFIDFIGKSSAGKTVAYKIVPKGIDLADKKIPEYKVTLTAATDENLLDMDADLAKNRWHGEGTSNKYPSASGLRRGWNQKMSNYFVEDGSFFRIENITLGYTIKSFHYSGITMPEARITLTAEKPLTAFSYNGFNPEIENGIDTQTYPIPAIYTIGLSLKF